jgi:hypothetical protein
MFEDLTISPVSKTEFTKRMLLAIACSAAMLYAALSPAIAANKQVVASASTSCEVVSGQAATFARVHMGVTEAC